MGFQLSNYRIINKTYYFRLKIPPQIRHWFGGSAELLHSLKTSDRKLAAIKLAEKTNIAKKYFLMLHDDGIEEAVKQNLVRLLWSDRRKKAISTKDLTVHTRKLSHVIASFLASKEENKKLSEGTKIEIRHSMEILAALIKDKIFVQITRDELKECVRNLELLPANMRKKKQFQGKTIRQIITMSTPEDRISESNVDKHVGWISALWNYAVREGYIERSPALQLKPKARDRKENKKRRPYTNEELQRLFDQLSWKPDKPSHFWVPLLLCFQGTRENEMCQLEVADIKRVDNIWCIDINGNVENVPFKRLKKPHCARVLPVHEYLVHLGFIEYVRYCEKNKLTRIFEELTLNEKKKKYNHEFSKWFSRTLNPKVRNCSLEMMADAHSLRHGFINYLLQRVDVPIIRPYVVSEMVGHDVPGIRVDTETMKTYKQEYTPQLLSQVLEYIDFQRTHNTSNLVKHAQACMSSIGSKYHVPDPMAEGPSRRLNTSKIKSSGAS